MTQSLFIFGENRYPNTYMPTIVDKDYENYILDIVDRAADDYYVELNHGVITLSDLVFGHKVDEEEIQYLVDQGKLKISSVDLENPESIDGAITYGVRVVHRPGTELINEDW